MSNNNSIDELRAQSDAAEEELRRTMRIRKAAIEASQASKAAAKARSKYQRALGQQAEAGADA
jgi:hypothetical protein